MQTNQLVLCELQDTGTVEVESWSPFCLKVHRALRAAGLRYTRQLSDRPDAWRRYSVTGQVPVLLVDGEPVADSTRILARIESLGGRSLLPWDPRARAEALLWEELADAGLNGFLVAARWADQRNWPATRAAYFAAMPAPVRAIVPRILRRKILNTLVARDVWRRGAEDCWRRFEILLDALEARAPDTGFWSCDAIGVADVALFGQLHGLRTALTPWQRECVEARPRLLAWLDRVDLATRPMPALVGAARTAAA
jgi:glutathione S-transferase